ncbi:unnamed protein product [Blepharisma stoltei]|uniref:TNFR-Cys domain-containing protein n=1 Tax=Blepharisma stoltei TaxID=1481888 RepID=A0AAU9J9L0_9CILI|nr:unnamed protein product [Blepharisma stoltei]
MGRSTRLKACFIIFCLSFVIATYSPFAKWVFTPNNLVDGKIKDLSSNSNEPFAGDGNIIATSDVTCKGFHIYSRTAFYWGTASAIPSSTVEFGVSIWMSLQGNGYPVYIARLYSDMTSYYTEFKDQILIFRTTEDEKKEVPISEGKWIFLVYYFVKIQSLWTLSVISPEFSTVTLTDAYEPGKLIMIGNIIDAYYYEIQFFKKATINSSIVTLYDNLDATYDATTSTCSASCNTYCHPDVGCLSSTPCPCPTLCTCSANDGVCSSCNDPNGDLANKCQCKTNYALEGLTCVLSNFYADSPLNCALWTAEKVCTQCNPSFFLYNSGSITSCLACDSCTSCNASPTCFKCTDVISQVGNSCIVDSVGYKLSFASPNIVFDFAYPLAKTLKISNLKATTADNQAIATTTWQIHSQTASQLQIRTDLILSQLPIKLDFSFEQDP